MQVGVSAFMISTVNLFVFDRYRILDNKISSLMTEPDGKMITGVPCRYKTDCDGFLW